MAKKDDALARQQEPGALSMERPSFIETEQTGLEDVGSDDLRLPRLAIAQGLSHQMIPTNALYMPDLKMFQLFNDLTNEIYGMGPLTFFIVRRDVKRIEFDPNDRNIPIDLDVPAGDPRTLWTKDENGKGVPPRATKFVEFIICLLTPDANGRFTYNPDQIEPIVLSIQETNKFNKRAHERLTGYAKLRKPPAPIYAGLYTIKSGTEQNAKGTFGVPVPANAGFITDPQLYAFAKKLNTDWASKTIHVTREVDDSFDAEEMERQAAADNSGM